MSLHPCYHLSCSWRGRVTYRTILSSHSHFFASCPDVQDPGEEFAAPGDGEAIRWKDPGPLNDSVEQRYFPPFVRGRSTLRDPICGFLRLCAVSQGLSDPYQFLENRNERSCTQFSGLRSWARAPAWIPFSNSLQWPFRTIHFAATGGISFFVMAE